MDIPLMTSFNMLDDHIFLPVFWNTITTDLFAVLLYQKAPELRLSEYLMCSKGYLRELKI